MSQIAQLLPKPTIDPPPKRPTMVPDRRPGAQGGRGALSFATIGKQIQGEKNDPI
jgi:hypothetical protein